MIVVLAVVAPFDQAKVERTAVALSTTDVLLHFNIVSSPALMVGGVRSWVTITASLEVQPL